ncbi:purine-nucleoside phosphorylase [Flammeovirga kamogawensis]|uniref:Purine nucleoside phosphorylase n=1 Tax=Flammeovirga kamogawensis TaxID=373891 RepID=A0ABX8GTU6_9BACT|nr:purine-nucleoside phosphorylase [Flammeovirga kamogawensis]MBB6460113.1 purine-nucleoside phosphorylase [Flammeovirga kamogawensis]QWG06844.1 purine-nucleoside phosphorylase [Flammeovirga kamogawensis]TRX68668.1 purine-nucleoside phosphorylase [Flammeovirga kamogawensis]
MTHKEKVESCIEKIQKLIDGFQPEVGIVLGTGLGGLVNEFDIKYDLSYEKLPHFPLSTVESHKGRLIFGYLNGRKIVAMQGRFHFYEGYDMKEVTFPIRVLKLLGVKALIVSNAAGGINPSFQKSDLMIINDHINLMFGNPLIGKNEAEWGDRFPDMFAPYNAELIEKAKSIAKENNLPVHEGVYAAVTGPNLETKAEYKYLSIIGADVVGMSTVPEVIVAVQMKLPVFAVSVVTDLCYEGALKPVELEEILANARNAEPHLSKLIGGLLTKI